jgi:transposase InsO family protein
LVATNYFTKWVEAIPLRTVTSKNMVDFVTENIIYRFGIPQTITTDQGTMFTSEEFRDFAASMRIKLLNSSPYYAQENGQAEPSNQILIKLIKRKIEEQPRKWYLTLNEALWAYRMACHGSTKSSPYELLYGHNVVLPWEIQTGSRRVTLQNDLTTEVYKDLMVDDLEDLNCHQVWALENIEANKLRVAKHYNKKVRSRGFSKGDLV